jgi:hypothetical protein
MEDERIAEDPPADIESINPIICQRAVHAECEHLIARLSITVLAWGGLWHVIPSSVNSSLRETFP